MSLPQHYVSEAVFHTNQALARMPVRSSAIARQMVKANLPAPETKEDIERYVHDLLTPKEQYVCDSATD